MSQSHTLLTDTLEINTDEQLTHLLTVIFHDDHHYAKRLSGILSQADPEYRQITNIADVIKILKKSFKESINWDGFIQPLDAKHLQQLTEFEERTIVSQNIYSDVGKPRKESIFWPTPTHPKRPSSRFSTLPYVRQHPLIDKNTPIGSAGSCFAIEIARALQEKEFNYVITERADNPESGVYVDGYTAGDQFAPGSFSSGLQFNTGNFKHLAERAFNTRDFKKLLVKQTHPSGNEYYVDPYREDVYFLTEQNYLDDYEKHKAAIRQALTTCEVFILTPGLNECWKFTDGTYMARNPKAATYPYAKHTTLSVAENVENLETFLSVVKQYNPNFKLILSLSPVPFLATGRGISHHVIEANCHSKSVLRVAIEEVIKNNKDTFYLPSYEFVTYCQKTPWMEDDRHVQRDTVRQIIDMFSDMFFK